MTRSLVWLIGLFVVCGSVCWWRVTHRSQPERGRDHIPPLSSPTGRPDSSRLGAVREHNEARVDTDFEGSRRLTYAQAWNGSLPPEMAAFRDWANRYVGVDSAARSRLEPEGITLARARIAAMRDLIVTDPERALATTVPAAVREKMPEAVQMLLEKRIAGRGDYLLMARTPQSGSEPSTATLQRRVHIGDTAYIAHVYGRRAYQITKRGISLHGIVLENDLALHESPVRALEPDEGRVASTELLSCPVSERPAEFNDAASVTVPAEAFGRVWEFCSETADMLEQFEQRLVQDEGNARPPAFHSGANFSTAAAPPTSHTLGTKRVLVIRVDFSDRPGAPFAVEFGQAIMDFSVRPFFQTSSYGQTTLLSTITPKVYRLPRTAVSYAVSAAEYDLHRDAVAAAAADFPVGTFDRVIVAFNHIGSSQIPGSQINFGGSGMVGGSEIWINGSFTFGIVAHELGHTYGLLHANLWQVNDGNPLSSTGKSSEYGDPFDIMGSGGTDVRFDFNMFEKNRLGWLPDQRVKTITASGTHRVYRFDHKDALALNQPLALRVARDGTRSYWIGLRQNFPGNASLTNGAYILWGYDSARPTDLLDLTTPGTNTDDAALALGRTFTDPAYGITFRVIARGGADVATFLDLEITIPATAPNNVVGWDGLQTVPPGITNVRAVAADDSHVLALKHDGTVVSWWVGGEPFAVPAGITNVASIAVGSGSSGVVKTDGTVHLWGNLFTSFAPPPSGLTGIRQLAIGGFHALALKYDGSVIVWGSNDSGQSSLPTGLNQVVAIAAGSRTSFALKADGTVVRWGATYPDEIPLPPGLKNVIGIAAYSAGRHLLALKPDGTVVAAGENVVGQSDVPSALNQVVAIAPGYSTSLALRADGTVAMWGNRGSFSPPPANLPRVFGIATNSNGSLALTGTGAFVLTQPESKTVASGSSTSLNVTVSAVGAATYQWRKDGSAIGGATDATLTLANPNPTDAGFYDVVVTTPTNATTSMPARLAVVAPLVIARQPLPQAVELGARADFSVEATGSGPVTFQWRRNGSPIVGATANGLSFGSVTMEDAAVYDVLLTDGVSTLSSRAVELSAFATTRLANLSIRGTTGTGPQTLIVGFVLGGQPPNAAKPLLLRGAGPALAVFGVRDPLADPKIELYRDTTRIGENDNWAGSAQVTAVGSQVGAFAFPTPSSRDAALYSDTLPAGAYTLQATSVDRAAGVVLAEIYDATPSNAFGAKTQRLVNLSARTFVGTSDSVLIAGFSISGGRNKTVLIRGVGPALAGLGVGGALADPKLELFSSTTAKLQENDNWSGSSVLAGTFRTVGAFPLLEDSKDAALLATLEPGSYTVQVSGVGGTTGVALVEIYEVP